MEIKQSQLQMKIHAIGTHSTSKNPVAVAGTFNLADPLLLVVLLDESSEDLFESDPGDDDELVLELGSDASLKIFASGEFGGSFSIPANYKHRPIIYMST